MLRVAAALAVIVAACALAAGATAATIHCLPGSVGSGKYARALPVGARCMLAAYRNSCHAADYALSAFGVDTVRTESFRLIVRSRRCRVSVTETLRILPKQRTRVVRQRLCAGLKAIAGDVVADRCSGRGPATISLTKFAS